MKLPGKSLLVLGVSGATLVAGALTGGVALGATHPGPSVKDVATASAGKDVALSALAIAPIRHGKIVAAQYQLRLGMSVTAWQPMAAADRHFNSRVEKVVASIGLPARLGDYTVCVRAKDQLGFWTQKPSCLKHAFTVNVVADAKIVAHNPATTNSFTDTTPPDYVVYAVVGLVKTVPVGQVNIAYRSLGKVCYFVPAAGGSFAFYTGPARVDLGPWTSRCTTASTIQFLANGGYGLPHGAFYINTAKSKFMLPAGTVAWAPGVPVDRGFVAVKG